MPGHVHRRSAERAERVSDQTVYALIMFKRAVVTGGGSGLGKAFCLELARAKGQVLVADLDLQTARQTADEVRALGGEAIAVACDVGAEQQVIGLRDRVAADWGGVDLLINNAGVACTGPVGQIASKDWDWMHRVNHWGVVYGCQAFVPLMVKQGSGAILNVASCAGFISPPEMAPYNMSKAGVISLTETLLPELRPHGVTATVLCPSFVQTQIMTQMRSPVRERQLDLGRRMFEGAWMTPEQVVRHALKRARKGKLYAIPQIDARFAWRLKRWCPGLFSWLLCYFERRENRRWEQKQSD